MHGEAQFAGGESYANALTYRLQLQRDKGPFTWHTRNELSYVAGASDFDYVSGWRNRTRVQVDDRLGGYRLRLGYELELNDRYDLFHDPEFLSYSPIRHRVYANLRANPSSRVTVEAQGSFRLSTYDDEDRFFDDDGALVTIPRDRDISTVGLRIDYRMHRNWYLVPVTRVIDTWSD